MSGIGGLFTVVSYIPAPNDFHMCADENGLVRRIDLVTSGCLPEGVAGDALVGKKVSVEYTHPFIEMAENVAIVETEETYK